MIDYNEITGDLIELALQGKFDVIAHGCNCFCTMGAGIAPKIAEIFECDKYSLENPLFFKGDINKLGVIEHQNYCKFTSEKIIHPKVTVVNAYTQYYAGQNSPGCNIPLDYSALELCMRKINHVFAEKHIGLPKIGCGLAGGQWEIVKGIIQKELSDCKVTIVIYNK